MQITTKHLLRVFTTPTVFQTGEFDRICSIPASLRDSHTIVDPAGILLFKVHGPVTKRSEVCRGCTGISVVFPGSKHCFVSKSSAQRNPRNSQVVDVSFVFSTAFQAHSHGGMDSLWVMFLILLGLCECRWHHCAGRILQC